MSQHLDGRTLLTSERDTATWLDGRVKLNVKDTDDALVTRDAPHDTALTFDFHMTDSREAH